MLDDLLARVVDARERVVEHAGPTPVLLKIAPDLSLSDLDDIVGIARSRRVDGMIVGNTTLSRPKSLRETEMAKQAGGLSGRPLFPLATRMLAETYVRVEGVFPLIGAAESISAPPQSSNFAPVRAWFSFTRLWCFAASAWSANQGGADRRTRSRPPRQSQRTGRHRCRRGHRRAVAGVRLRHDKYSH